MWKTLINRGNFHKKILLWFLLYYVLCFWITIYKDEKTWTFDVAVSYFYLIWNNNFLLGPKGIRKNVAFQEHNNNMKGCDFRNII